MEQTVAKTILSQLGGSKFIAMTGARNLTSGSRELQVQFPGTGGRKAANAVRIELAADDTYRITAYHIARRGLRCDVVAKATGVYADNLRQTFETLTGLRTSL